MSSTQANYEALRAELADIKYATMSHEEAAASLAAPLRVGTKEYRLTSLAMADLLGIPKTQELLIKLSTLSGQSATPINPYSMVLSYLTTPGSQGVDMGNAKSIEFVQALVAGQLLDPADAQVLIDIAGIWSTRGIEVFGVQPNANDIAAARS